jgi:hypothetical protein
MIMTTKLRVLFLDDEQYRHVLFKKVYDRADHCYSYEDTVALLNQSEYNVMSLDHDLGWGKKDGTALAQFIADRDIKADAIILHSYNNAGVLRMKAFLQDNAKQIFCIPFGFNLEIYKSLNQL